MIKKTIMAVFLLFSIHQCAATVPTVQMPPILHMMQKSFFTAVREGDCALVENFHKAGMDLNSVDNNGSTALSSFLSTFKSEKPSINLSDRIKEGFIDPLKYIFNPKELADKHIKTVKYLVEHGAHITSSDLGTVAPVYSKIITTPPVQWELHKLLHKHASLSTKMKSAGTSLACIALGGYLFLGMYEGVNYLGTKPANPTRLTLWSVGAAGIAGIGIAKNQSLKPKDPRGPHFPAQ